MPLCSSRKKKRLHIGPEPIRIPIYNPSLVMGSNWWFWLLPFQPRFTHVDKILHYRIIPGLRGSLKATTLMKMSSNNAMVNPNDPSSGELSSGASSCNSPRNHLVNGGPGAVAGIVDADGLLHMKDAVKTTTTFTTSDPAVVEAIEKHRRRTFAGKMKHTAMAPVRMTTTVIGTVSDGVKNMLPPQQGQRKMPVFGKIMREKRKKPKSTKKNASADLSDAENSDGGPEDSHPPKRPYH